MRSRPEKRREKEYGSVRNLFSIFFQEFILKYLSVKFVIYDLKRFLKIGMK